MKGEPAESMGPHCVDPGILYATLGDLEAGKYPLNTSFGSKRKRERVVGSGDPPKVESKIKSRSSDDDLHPHYAFRRTAIVSEHWKKAAVGGLAGESNANGGGCRTRGRDNHATPRVDWK